VNRGLKIACGDYLLIANNDIIFTNGWFESMRNAIDRYPQGGLSGPISNAVSGVQLVKNIEYDSLEKMHEYAFSISEQNKGEIAVFPRIAFFCTLIKHNVLDAIGGLDERFSPGNFEDDDYCLRAQLAGFKTVIALDVFIHHFGSKSFTAEGNKRYHELLEKNRRKFILKWGADPDQIWLKGIKPKIRNLRNNLGENRVYDLTCYLQECLDDEDYESALFFINEIISLEGSSDGNIGKNQLNKLLDLSVQLRKLSR